ncbi:fatty-acid--CoA ligase, partial [Nocardia colli]
MNRRAVIREFSDYLDEKGDISLREGQTLVDFIDKYVAENGSNLAYRYIDYSRERDGEAQELTWREFGIRLRAV